MTSQIYLILFITAWVLRIKNMENYLSVLYHCLEASHMCILHISSRLSSLSSCTKITDTFYPNLLSIPIFDGPVLWCDVMVWDSVVFGSDVKLFSAPRSSDFCLNIHRDESPLSSHTHCEWSFVLLESSRDSKDQAQWLVSLSTVHSNMA